MKNEMNIKILATLGPASLNQDTVERLAENGVSLFRINLSHTAVDDVREIVTKIQSWTDVPVCLDSEGAQIRNQQMSDDTIYYTNGDVVKIHHETVIGDNKNISFVPKTVSSQLIVGDEIRVDFNSVKFCITEIHDDYLLATVVQAGYVGSNKAADLSRHIDLDPVTDKDKEAFKIGLDLGVTHFALSFTNSAADVHEVRKIIGNNSNLISKIESIKGVLNLGEILALVDQILIDRGDLSREVDIEKIPFIQRRIISHARSHETPAFVATNLLESMIHTSSPTRAEVNDVASTLLMGCSGLVLAAETAIGAHPVGAVQMIASIIKQFNRWTPDSSCKDIIF
jgi:pyruvate kinase